ncbi:hypothetical protein BH10ACT7_BH10ACT7_29390 [soil metagenome]
MIAFIVLAALGVAAIAWTVLEMVRDGYRRVPTRER